MVDLTDESVCPTADAIRRVRDLEVAGLRIPKEFVGICVTPPGVR